MINFYIDIKQEKYIDQTLCWLGIAHNNHQFNIVQKYNGTPSIPFIYIQEGIVGNDFITPIVQKTDNIEIYKNGVLVFKKCFSDVEPKKFYDNVFDLYNTNDRVLLNCLINDLENKKNDLVYFINTEETKILNRNFKLIAGLASGILVADLAYQNKSKKIIFFDYSINSLNYQKELIYSKNRASVITKFLNKNLLINGVSKSTINDIKNCDMSYINKIYDYLQEQSILFLNLDLRNIDNVQQLFSLLDDQSCLWLSNIFYYPTTINYNVQSIFSTIDQFLMKKDITILDHTRMTYENSNN